MTIAVVVIHSDEGTGEGEGFAVGYSEESMMPAGGSANPATSKAHPKMHIAVARRI